MKLSDLTSGQLVELSRLIAQKEKVAAELAAIEAKIERFNFPGATGTSDRVKGARRGPKKGSKPGRLKEVILEMLKAAGPGGLTVKEMAEKMNVKPNNVYGWCYATGRKIEGFNKVGDKYIYNV